ncbi:MAG: hypothetical protein ACFFD2_21985, partial [Promethearchaeota archaeon]
MSAKKKSKRRFFTRQLETVFFVILVLSVLGISLIFFINNSFLNNGGFTRNILFIKPTEDGNPGYFIIIDDIYPTRDKIPVDWILHGRGNLSTFANNQSAVWEVESYLNSNDIVKLYAIFVEPEIIISESVGSFYPTQSYVGNPIKIPYIKARATQSGPTRFLTILFPLSGSRTLPNITTDHEVGLTQISENDLIFSQNSTSLKSFKNFTTNAEILFIRMNNSKISSYILRKGKYLTHQGRIYLESQNSLSMNL